MSLGALTKSGPGCLLPAFGLRSTLEGFMHVYRSHTCGQLKASDAGITARLSGWVHRKRDHGNLLFVDLRDHYGLTQCVIDISSPVFAALEKARPAPERTDPRPTWPRRYMCSRHNCPPCT